MTNPSIARSRRARIRRTGAAVLLASGLAVSGTAVASAGSALPASASAPAAVDVVGLKKGAYGDAVKALQEALVRVGVGVKYGVDSYFGSATQASVKAFQRYKGLPVTGVVDQATAAALGLAPAPRRRRAAAAAADGVAGPRVRPGSRSKQLQQALIAAGIPVAGGADGIFGVATERAPSGRSNRPRASASPGPPTPPRCSALGGGARRRARPRRRPRPSASPGLRLGNRGPAVVAAPAGADQAWAGRCAAAPTASSAPAPRAP